MIIALMRGMKNLEECVMLFSVESAAAGMVADLHMMSRFAFLLISSSDIHIIVFYILILWPVIAFNRKIYSRKI